jgi:hypothetical protein
MARRSLNLGLFAHRDVVHQGRLSDSLEEGAASLMSRSEKDDFLKRCRVPPEEVTMAKVVETGVTPKQLHQLKMSKAIRMYNKVADAFINNELPMLSQRRGRAYNMVQASLDQQALGKVRTKVTPPISLFPCCHRASLGSVSKAW